MEQLHQVTEVLSTSDSSGILHQTLRGSQSALRMMLWIALANGCSKPVDGPVKDGQETRVAPPMGEEPIQYLDLEAKVKVGQRVFRADRFFSQKISAEHGNSLSEFIKGKLDAMKAVPADAPEGTERSYIYGIVELCKKANLGVDLDNFGEINGKTIMFPAQVFENAVNTGLQQSPEAVAQLALLDGYPINKPEKRQEIYDYAIKNGVELTHANSGAYKAEGYADSPAFMLPDAAEAFSDLSRAFYDRTVGEEGNSGWSIVYTHVLRDSALQTKQPGSMGNAHLTGRAINICTGRYRTPGGEEVTWKNNPEFRSFIEKELQPTLKALLDESGEAYYPGDGFYDVYFQKVNTVVFDGI